MVLSGCKPVKCYDGALTANNSSRDDFETSLSGHFVRCKISVSDCYDKLKLFSCITIIASLFVMGAGDKDTCRYHYTYTKFGLLNKIVGSYTIMVLFYYSHMSYMNISCTSLIRCVDSCSV